MESHHQAPALAALGRYFEVVEHRADQAARCYKKALALDPTLADAGAGAGAGGGGVLEGLRSGLGPGAGAGAGPATPPGSVGHTVVAGDSPEQ